MAKTILVVDDEEDIRAVLVTILEKEGYHVITANNGDECLKKVSDSVDLILLDIMMPGTPVGEVIKKITKTKILFCTVVKTTEAEKELLFNGDNIVDFIQKPFDIEDVIKKVKKNLVNQ